MKCIIKENSFIAGIAAWKLGFSSAAIVIGKTIYLHNATKQELIHNNKWLRHEIAHIKQYKQYGNFLFIIMYLVESIKKGYKNNKFEIMARDAEQDEKICDDVTIQ